jgi:hypothetical protein
MSQQLVVAQSSERSMQSQFDQLSADRNCKLISKVRFNRIKTFNHLALQRFLDDKNEQVEGLRQRLRAETEEVIRLENIAKGLDARLLETEAKLAKERKEFEELHDQQEADVIKRMVKFVLSLFYNICTFATFSKTKRRRLSRGPPKSYRIRSKIHKKATKSSDAATKMDSNKQSIKSESLALKGMNTTQSLLMLFFCNFRLSLCMF